MRVSVASKMSVPRLFGQEMKSTRLAWRVGLVDETEPTFILSSFCGCRVVTFVEDVLVG
jgi:hypothetical protein